MSVREESTEMLLPTIAPRFWAIGSDSSERVVRIGGNRSSSDFSHASTCLPVRFFGDAAIVDDSAFASWLAADGVVIAARLCRGRDYVLDVTSLACTWPKHHSRQLAYTICRPAPELSRQCGLREPHELCSGSQMSICRR